MSIGEQRMDRLNSIEELQALRERMSRGPESDLPVIVISAGTCGQASGANDLIRIAKREILARRTDRRPLSSGSRVVTGSVRRSLRCWWNRRAVLTPGLGIKEMVPRGARRRAAAKFSGPPVARSRDPPPRTKQEDIAFFRKQTRTILSRNRMVDPMFLTLHQGRRLLGAGQGAVERRC